MFGNVRFQCFIRSEINALLKNRHLSTRRSKRSAKSFERNLTKLVRPTLFTVGFTGAVFASCSVWKYTATKNVFSMQRNHSVLWTEWNRLTDSRRLMMKIVTLNAIVFLGWRIRRLQGFMTKYFTSTPYKINLAPMILSTFSHQHWFHLFCNMYVLWSFADPIIERLGKHQFLAVYLSSGVISTWSSYVVRLLSRVNVASLGASGAVMALIGFLCLDSPDSRLCIVFLPFINFSAKSGLCGIIAFDLLGLIRRWTTIDHAAHLGGVFFGISYAVYGRQIYRNMCQLVDDTARKIQGRR